MSEPYDLILRGGTIAAPEGTGAADVGVRQGRIASIGSLGRAAAKETLDVRGLHVLPGVIDPHVHFREPGGEQKEEIETGSRAAVLGGVTAVFEMPNTNPPTTTPEALADKLARAAARCWCDHAFFLGATAENIDSLGSWELLPGCCGVKVFAGSSTGSLLLEKQEDLRRLFARVRRRVVVHSEDEARLRERRALAGTDPGNHPLWRDPETAVRSTRRILALAREAGRAVHFPHVSTAEEVPLLAEARPAATMEVTPQHLLLESPDCYRHLGTRAQMNPPIREARHRRALWQAVAERVVDCVGSDHAPHTLEEKARPYPESPSGLPGVQTLVPLFLDAVASGRLRLERFVELTSAGPARVFGIAGKGRLAVGFDADLTIVDLKERRIVSDGWIASRCGWSPYVGMLLVGWPRGTVVRGAVVVRDGEIQGSPAGRPVRFF